MLQSEGEAQAMSEPTDLDAHRPHMTHFMTCYSCNHAWRGVCPENTKALQCPKCAQMVSIGNYGTEIIGPFRGGYYTLVSHGFKVPNVQLYKREDTETDWTLRLDGRWEVDVDTEEVLRWTGTLANAMAISAGYTKHGEGSERANPFTTRMTQIDESDQS